VVDATPEAVIAAAGRELLEPVEESALAN
jgi:hypothetical protein